MPRPKSTRVYLRTNRTVYRRLAWLQNNRTNELILGLYGLTGDQPILRYMWPEREIGAADFGPLAHEIGQAKKIDALVDHITCRADGTFQIQTKDYEHTITHDIKRTEPLGPDTKVFLELMIRTDRVSVYAPIDGPPKHPSVRMDVAAEHRVSFHAMFSGVNNDVDSELAATMPKASKNHERIRFHSKTLQGTLMGRQESLPEQTRDASLRGTLLSIKFPVDGKRWHIKSFLFE
ncbi:MAG TPA: hypothetical protein EYN60_08375 [Nitrospirales bacterium]|nr:hypothetical protein [Nitrospirales bacterium]HIA14033.1 hypothetical protein [Nitrospirales bacterium]HIN33994.1 hypothetical protein [Nitrospirales bacterium]